MTVVFSNGRFSEEVANFARMWESARVWEQATRMGLYCCLYMRPSYAYQHPISDG